MNGDNASGSYLHLHAGVAVVARFNPVNHNDGEYTNAHVYQLQPPCGGGPSDVLSVIIDKQRGTYLLRLGPGSLG